MRTAPEDLDEGDLVTALRDGWDLDVAELQHAAVGGGSHHWTAAGRGGHRHWVTVDDLDHKGYLGATRDGAFDALRAAFDTALALRASGLEFVVAPEPTPGGESVRRLDDRYSVAVFPFLDGSSRPFGQPLPAAEAAELTVMLVRVHGTAPPATAVRPASLQPASRAGLEDALHDLGEPWTGGPYSEPARALVAARLEDVRRLLAEFDHLADRVAAAGATPVVTHGEPHPGNVVVTGGRLHLVDWDTVALAPPERDLWMLHGELARYTEASGRPVEEAAIRLYRLRWALDDAALFVTQLRSPHGRTADSEHAWRALVITLDGLGAVRP